MSSETEYLAKMAPFLNRKVRAKSDFSAQWRYFFIVTSVEWRDGYPLAKIVYCHIDGSSPWDTADVSLRGYHLEGFDG